MWLWALLAFAITLAFFKQRNLSVALAIVVVIAGVFTAKISVIGALFALLGFALAALIPKSNRLNRWLYTGLLVVWCAALFFHLVPGFHNLKALNHVFASPHSLPFSMYLNLDKPLIFFALILAHPNLFGSGAKPNKRAIVFTIVPLFALLLVAQFLGAIKPEFSVPSWWWLFALNNLLLVCATEEALFRGFFQQEISRKLGRLSGLFLASILFGLSHYTGGLTLIIFATLAGVGYGLVFYFSKRLWAAVLVHFLFNMTHLIFFTYPAVAK